MAQSRLLELAQWKNGRPSAHKISLSQAGTWDVEVLAVTLSNSTVASNRVTVVVTP
jgi:hypothetical protein